MKFKHFPNISQFPKILKVVQQLVSQLVYTHDRSDLPIMRNLLCGCVFQNNIEECFEPIRLFINEWCHFANIWIRGEACENKSNTEKWPSQPVCNLHHLTAIPTVITLLILLGFQQRLASSVFPKNSQKGMLAVIWSDEERKKMVLESANPLECVRSIFSQKNFTDPLEVLRKDWLGEPDKFYTLETTLLSLKNIENSLSEDLQGRK